jgi:FdhD protein
VNEAAAVAELRLRATKRVNVRRSGRRGAAVDPPAASSTEAAESEDLVVVEEPLEIRLDDETLAVTMRTPGHDRELVLGFLLAEGIVRSASDVARLAPCGRTGDEGRDNTLAVSLAPGVKPPVDPSTGELVRRGTLMSSACGVCGRRTVEDLFERFGRVQDASNVARSVLLGAVEGLRERQPIFEVTGGCHAASLVTFDGRVVCTFEDVGRHNAVDKVVGSRMAKAALPLSAHVLVVSGRASFEIVQKAMAAGISVIASVSAPSSLAVALAQEAGIVLAGFVRGTSMTIYANADRVVA